MSVLVHSRRPAPAPAGDVHGIVTDSVSGAPIASAFVSIQRGTLSVLNTQTDAFGRYRAHNLADGEYTIQVRYIGFEPFKTTITVAGEDVRLDAKLKTATLTLAAVNVVGEAPIAIDTRTGDQTFAQERSHAAPTTTTSQVVQQSVAGAVRAPTGEVHIRGQHAEYTYYVDGVPVPSGVSGSLNELFDPAIVNSINFRTGGWDAEFGNKNAAIIDVATKIPTGGLHLNASGFGGAFGASGESLSSSNNHGALGYFASVSRSVSDMRTEPVLFDTTTFRPYNFHNHGEDLFGFGKVQYAPSRTDVVNVEGNWSRTRFQVPFDSTGGAQADDNQQDVNAFLNVGWRHRLSGDVSAKAEETTGPEIFTGIFYRYGSLTFTPGPNDDPQFVFFPDTNAYNLREDRSFTTLGLKFDYLYRTSHDFEFKTGVLTQFTRGREDFVTSTPDGATGPASNSNLTGHDIGGYAQTSWTPSEGVELRTGLRYDVHSAPFAGDVSQLSPRARLNVYFGPATTLYLYYGRLFVPTNVEDLRAVTSVAQGGVTANHTLPERDNFYEVGLLHRFPVGVVAKLSAYRKESEPGIDDNTVPGSAIVTSVNIYHVRVTGVEAVLEVHPTGPVSADVNVALNHAYGYGAITGGFFPSEPPSGYFDLDHDQRLSSTASVSYSAGNFFATATGIYGSGLTNGADPASCDCSGTGLLSFNKGVHVDPNLVENVSAGYTFAVGTTSVRPELFVENVFDKAYLLKGAFFSGASVGRPRTVQLRLNVGF